MERNTAEEKWEYSDLLKEEVEEEDEEEEALSLCDLPVNLVKEENQSCSKEEAETTQETNQEDFNFCSWGVAGAGSLTTKSEMCVADDIFFQGQILPLRFSVSSESGHNYKLMRHDNLNPSHSLSRSQSMDHGSLGAFTSFSSRSSSSRSHDFSSSSTSSSVSTTRISKPSIQNRFHTYPSPKPQIRLSSASLGNNRNRKSTSSLSSSSLWDFFRLGLVRTPEIELQDLKARSSVSRNSSSSSNNSSSSIKNSNSTINSCCSNKNGGSGTSKIDGTQGKNVEKQRRHSFLDKKVGGLLSGCSCSVSSVKPVPLNMVIIKSSNSTGKANNCNRSERESAEQKLQELKIKKKIVEKKQQKQGKQAMSRHRTFEWIKELSHASYLDHEQERGLLDS